MDKVSKKEKSKIEKMKKREKIKGLKEREKGFIARRGDTSSSDYYDNIGNCSATSWEVFE